MTPLYNLLNNRQPNMNMYGMNNNPMNNMMNMINQFNQFKSTFNGNPEQEVKQLLNSGRMSQQQYNYLSQMAQQLRGILK